MQKVKRVKRFCYLFANNKKNIQKQYVKNLKRFTFCFPVIRKVIKTYFSMTQINCNKLSTKYSMKLKFTEIKEFREKQLAVQNQKCMLC